MNSIEINTANANLREDTVYLEKQLQIIKTACEHYEDTIAYVALNRLKEKQWKPQTAEALEKIRDALFLHRNFAEAQRLIHLVYCRATV